MTDPLGKLFDAYKQKMALLFLFVVIIYRIELILQHLL